MNAGWNARGHLGSLDYMGLSGCNPTISNDFLMFSAVNELEEWLFNSLEEGALVHCTKVIVCMVIKNLGIGMYKL